LLISQGFVMNKSFAAMKDVNEDMFLPVEGAGNTNI
jgi:hypothetical protein